jgi:hypothetical protein
MTTRASTPEFEALLTQLEPLREQMRRRRPPLTEEEITAKLVAIARAQFEIVGFCAERGHEVRSGDPHLPLQPLGAAPTSHHCSSTAAAASTAQEPMLPPTPAARRLRFSVIESPTARCTPSFRRGLAHR